MKVEGIRTHKVIPGDNIFKLLDMYLSGSLDNTVLAVTSKIISICEGRIVKIKGADKDKLVIEESDLYLGSANKKYGAILTIKNNLLIPNSGIDESNGDGHYILWPKEPQKSANLIRAYVMKKYDIHNFGVIITDSKTTPLRWGTTGVAIAYSGIKPLRNYIGKKDIFRRKMIATKANLYDALAAAAVLVMGEGSEQTPMALISDLNFVKFCQKNPTKKELDELRIKVRDDLYGEILSGVQWKKNLATIFILH